MPWTTPETFTAGQTLTAASMNAIAENTRVLAALRNVATADVAGGIDVTQTSYTSATTPAVTLTTTTRALVIISAYFDSRAAGRAGFASFAVSGATTRAATDDDCLRGVSIGATVRVYDTQTRVTYLSGLTAGSNTFTMVYKGDTTDLITWSARRIIVLSLPD